MRYTYVFVFLQCHLFTMLAVFRCRHINIFFFVGIGLVLSTKSRSTGYNDKRKVVYIIYRAPNSRAITGDRLSQ